MLIVDLISLSYCTAVAILSIVLWCSTWLILIPFDSACLNNQVTKVKLLSEARSS